MSSCPHRPLHVRVAIRVARSKLPVGVIADRTGWSERRLKRLLLDETHLLAVDMETLARALEMPVGDLYLEPLGAK